MMGRKDSDRRRGGSRQGEKDSNSTVMPRSKTERRRSNSWAFYQLRQFLAYKGLGAGVEVIAINPRYTSQTCHQCLHIHPTRGESYRSGKSFKCGHCGWHGDADLNGALMIKLVGSSVNRPEGNELSKPPRYSRQSAIALGGEGDRRAVTSATPSVN